MKVAVLEREIKRVLKGLVFLVSASADTPGQGTTGQARCWSEQLAGLLQASSGASQ